MTLAVTTPVEKIRIIDSPIGQLTLSGFGDTLTGLSMEISSHPRAVDPDAEHDPTAFADAVDQLGAYFAGKLQNFDVKLQMYGTLFQQKAWAALCTIPYGETISYGEQAWRVGNPKASRAVGLANGRNPIAIIVPCHRVIGADKKLTGFGGGLDRKAWLLSHERANAQTNV